MDDREMDGIELVGGILMVLAGLAVVYGSRNYSSIGVVLGVLGAAGGIAMLVVRFRRVSRRRRATAALEPQSPNGSV